MTKNELDTITVDALPPLTPEEIEESIKEIETFFKTRDDTQYFMLLQRDTNYYTIFDNISNMSIKKVVKNIINFIQTDPYLTSIGVIKHIETQDFVEIWVGSYHFALFEAGGLVIKL